MDSEGVKVGMNLYINKSKRLCTRYRINPDKTEHTNSRGPSTTQTAPLIAASFRT